MMLLGFFLAGVAVVIARPSTEKQGPEPYLTNPLVTHRCYGDLGCYDTKDFYDLKHRPINLVPDERDSINTRFGLYCRQNKPGTTPKPQFLKAFDANSFKKSHFNAKLPIKFLVHGFLDTGFLKWVNSMGNALLAVEDANIIAVDWSGGNGLPYTQASANTWIVGGEIYNLVKFMMQEYKVSLDQIHIIGHSLGAHVAGFAGTRLGGKVARITGLDPAEPYFQYMPEGVRLDPADAQYVDVIHSDAKSILLLGFGMVQPVGHLDFYPNGGQDQPGCDLATEISHIVVDGLQETIRQVAACNHMRAIELFTDSILSGCSFLAHECDSYEDFLRGKCVSCGKDGSKCAKLGYKSYTSHPAPKSKLNRKLYLSTASKSPFCVSHYEVRVSLENRKEQGEEKGTLFVTLKGSQSSTRKTQLNAKTVDMKKGQSYSFVIASPKPLGHVKNLEFYWKSDWSVLNPGSWFHKGSLWLRSVHVEPLDLQPEDKRVAEGSTLCVSSAHAIEPKTNAKLSESSKCKK